MSFYLNLLGWHRLTKLYRFPVHSSTARHLCTVVGVHHPCQVSVHHHLFPHTLSTSLYPSPDNHHTVVHIHEFFFFFYFCAQSPHIPGPPTAVSLLSIWVCLYFVKIQIFNSHNTEWENSFQSLSFSCFTSEICYQKHPPTNKYQV